MTDLRYFFDRIVVVNLDRREDRWVKFQLRAKEAGITGFERFRAIDGTKYPPPDWFLSGEGAWGCYQSHLRIAQDAMQDGIGSYLVLEDDVVFRPDFAERLETTLAAAGDYDCLYLGGFHLKKPAPLVPGLVRATNVNRTHAFAVGKSFMPDMVKHLNDIPLYLSKITAAPEKNCPPFSPHIDFMLGYLHEQGRHRVLAAEPWLCGQAGGMSDIIDRQMVECYWDLVPQAATVTISGL